MKYRIIFFLFFSSIVHSQIGGNGLRAGISVPELEAAKVMYLNMMKTPGFKEREECAKEYVSKLPRGFRMEDLVSEKDFIAYISENLQYSKFNNVGEALALRKRCADIEEQLYNDNLALYKLMQTATLEQNKIILAPMFADLKQRRN